MQESTFAFYRDGAKVMAADLAKMGEQVFISRYYAGFSVDDAASREEKDNHGQDVWADGELGAKTPFTISAMPQTLEIMLPS